MPIPTINFIRLRLGGSLATDTWSVGFGLDVDDEAGIPSVSTLTTYINSIIGIFNTDVWSAGTQPLKARNTAAVTLANGHATHYSNGSATVGADGSVTPVAGTGTSGTHPASAMVVSLHTGFTGRARRGRMYLPMTGALLTNTTLQEDSTTTTQLTANMVTFFQAVNALALPWSTAHTGTVSVVSESLGILLGVLDIKMDSIMDTQRGRSDKFTPVAIGVGTL